MAVNVDVCQPGMICLAAECEEPALLWIESERSPRMHYCPGHLISRIYMYQEQNRGVTVTDAAKEQLLGEVEVPA
jgi:hypothetical protein